MPKGVETYFDVVPATVDGLSGVSVGRGWRTERHALKQAETCGVLLCSSPGRQKAEYITWQTLVLDGGLTAA